jgi:hypothetical protein
VTADTQTTIALLEELLAAARAEKLVGLAVVAATRTAAGIAIEHLGVVAAGLAPQAETVLVAEMVSQLASVQDALVDLQTQEPAPERRPAGRTLQ